MQKMDYMEVVPRGTLAHRLLMNYHRMESTIYRPDTVFSSETNETWPGDWCGRIVLALVMLARSTGREPAYLEEILDELENHLNERGYLGRILPSGTVDEQQLSGHNWLLRGLIEYSLWKGDERTKRLAEGIVRELYLPVVGLYRRYPAEVSQRAYYGRPDGELTGDNINGWYTSTDIGCAYICLDALSQAYKELHMTELQPLLEEMIDTFMRIDFVGLSVQTHATLSASRGILRYYEATGNPAYLEDARRIFQLYTASGMTETYGNLNWFRRSSWTEPCAIIDSCILAAELFRLTGETPYLEWTHKIYFNALSYAQRPNGGFGCDNCTGTGEEALYLTGVGDDECREAYWCCTMRGGEGLARLAQSLAVRDKETLYLCLYNDSLVRHKGLTLEIKTRYPMEGQVRIRAEVPEGGRELALFVPGYASGWRLELDGEQASPDYRDSFLHLTLPAGSHRLLLDFPIPLIRLDVRNAEMGNCYKLAHGFLLLGTKDPKTECRPDAEAMEYLGEGRYIDRRNGIELCTLQDVCDMTCAQFFQDRRQMLFRV